MQSKTGFAKEDIFEKLPIPTALRKMIVPAVVSQLIVLIYNMADTFRRVDVTAVSGNVIITAPVEAMEVNLRSISGRVRTEGVSIRDGEEGVPSVRVTGVTADLKLISIKE